MPLCGFIEQNGYHNFSGYVPDGNARDVPKPDPQAVASATAIPVRDGLSS